MVAVRVAHEYMPWLGPMRIEPQAKAGQVDATLMIFECKRRHAVRLTGLKRKSTQRVDAPNKNAPAVKPGR